MNARPSPQDIAARLTPGQRSTMLGLDQDFCLLGCSEATARRLSVGTDARPALTLMRKGDDGPEFALSQIGEAVKAVLS